MQSVKPSNTGIELSTLSTHTDSATGCTAQNENEHCSYIYNEPPNWQRKMQQKCFWLVQPPFQLLDLSVKYSKSQFSKFLLFEALWENPFIYLRWIDWNIRTYDYYIHDWASQPFSCLCRWISILVSLNFTFVEFSIRY